jgi:hypothetical protein
VIWLGKLALMEGALGARDPDRDKPSRWGAGSTVAPGGLIASLGGVVFAGSFGEDWEYLLGIDITPPVAGSKLTTLPGAVGVSGPGFVGIRGLAAPRPAMNACCSGVSADCGVTCAAAFWRKAAERSSANAVKRVTRMLFLTPGLVLERGPPFPRLQK